MLIHLTGSKKYRVQYNNLLHFAQNLLYFRRLSEPWSSSFLFAGRLLRFADRKKGQL